MNRILLLLLLVGPIACKKEQEKPAPFTFIYDGTATVLRNGMPWNAKVSCGYFPQWPHIYTLRIATFDQDGYINESLILAPIPHAPYVADTLCSLSSSNTRTIDSPLLQANYTRFFGRDVTSGAWNLDFSLPHRIALTYDSVSKQVSGTFEAGFWIGVDTAYSPWGKPVHFTNGTFTVKMQQYQIPGE